MHVPVNRGPCLCLWKYKAKRLRRIILVHFGLITFRLAHGKTKTPQFMISEFSDMSLSPKTNIIHPRRPQDISKSPRNGPHRVFFKCKISKLWKSELWRHGKSRHRNSRRSVHEMFDNLCDGISWFPNSWDRNLVTWSLYLWTTLKDLGIFDTWETSEFWNKTIWSRQIKQTENNKPINQYTTNQATLNL